MKEVDREKPNHDRRRSSDERVGSAKDRYGTCLAQNQVMEVRRPTTGETDVGSVPNFSILTCPECGQRWATTVRVGDRFICRTCRHTFVAGKESTLEHIAMVRGPGSLGLLEKRP